MLRLLPCVLLLLVIFAACDTEPQSPNVLFLIADDLNNDLGSYGHPYVQSPHLDRLAAQGVRFDRAYCQYPVCNPSRSSFLTGLYPHQTGVLSNADSFRVRLPDVATLPQWFKQNGYYTARVGKIFHFGVPNQIGTDGMDDPASWHEVVNPRGIDREVHDRIHTLQPGRFGGTLSWLNLDSADEDHTDGLGATAAIRLLEEHHPEKTGTPLFLAVGFYRPHTPYVAPSPYFDLYPTERIEPLMMPKNDRDDIPLAALDDRPHQLDLTVQQRREIIQAYYAATTFMDAQVGRVLDAVERLGLSDNTIIVFISDHGYHLGQHGLWQKGDLFEGSVRVPLILSVPGQERGGADSQALVELVDLYPTLVDLSNLPHPPHLLGQSLRPILENPAQPLRTSALTIARSRAARMHPGLNGKRPMGFTIRTPRYRYTEWGDGGFGRELYDYRQDPGELTNLAEHPLYADTLALLQKEMGLRKQEATSLP